MSGYTLKPNEVLNGGYTVKIGDYFLRNIGEYVPEWTNVYDDENNFTDYEGNIRKFLFGRRFSLKLRTGRLTKEETDALRTELCKSVINVECPDFTGECICDDIPAELRQANFLGERYSASFTLTAKSLIRNGGGL